MKHKNKKSIILATAIILIVSGLLFYRSGASHKPQIKQPSSPITSNDSQNQNAPDNTNNVILAQSPNTPNSTQSVDKVNVATSTTISDSPLLNKSPSLSNSPDAPQVEYHLLGTTNDPWLNQNWAMSKVQVDRAWDLTIGSSNIAVAVIDSGFELNHQDLKNRWFTNTDESGQTSPGDFCWTGTPQDKSTNNCDDDQNGYIDDYRGYDFVNLDNEPQSGTTNPSGEATHHGSMVAGVIGATANNNAGSAGIDQSAKILPLQVFTDDGQADTSTVTAAIDYATDMGAKVINLSLGADTNDNTLRSAINRAQNNGVVVVVASGNCALNDEQMCNNLPTPGRMTYPALYPEVIAVGATDANDNRASFSSYGPQLDLVAPGSAVGPLPVYHNGADNYYANGSGTSFSAPLVAGLASILISQNPSASISEIENTLTKSTDTTPEMNSNTFSNLYGFGRINAHKATLLALAKNQTNRLGSELTKVSLPAVGALWRAANGAVSNDEWLLFGCRTFQTDTCTITLTKGTSKYQTNSLERGDQIRYLFVKGSAMNSSGTWTATAHNSHFASSITTITK